MNSVNGKITSIKVNGSLSLVKALARDIPFSVIVIETPITAPYLKEGNNIRIIFKETEVAIGTGKEHAISMQNKVVGKIIELENGELLSKLTLDTAVGKITAIITSDAVHQLQLHTGKEVTALIKTNEIMLSQ